MIFQWIVNGTNLIGATNRVLTLTNIQPYQAGNYSVLVSNSLGSVFSSMATLTVNQAPSCSPAPANIIGWWRAEGNALDAVTNNNGTVSNISYTTAEVGQGFVFNGFNSYITIGNPPIYQVQNFTVEAWIRRFSSTSISLESPNAELFCYGTGGYGFGMWADGRLYITKAGVDNLAVAAGLTDTNNFHHVAVTKSGTNVIFYLDGNAIPGGYYGSTFVFTSSITIGADTGSHQASLYGIIDEVSLYSRALSQSEIQSIYYAGVGGKCLLTNAPVISQQPSNTTVLSGGTAAFSVSSGGTYLTYKWFFKGARILGATNSTLILTNVQSSQSGNYWIVVTNPYGTATSSQVSLMLNSNCVSTALGLVDLWSGENNGNDSIGQNYGFLQNGIGFAKGESGQAFSLNGSNANVYIPASPSLNIGTTGSGITMECWIKPNDLTDLQSLFEWNNGTSSGVQFCINVSGALGGLYVNFTDTSGGNHYFNSTAGILNTNNYQHVAATYDTNTGIAVLYYNGVAVGTQTIGKIILQTSYDLSLGNELAHGGTFFYNGLMDEASLYNRALSAPEIQEMYMLGSGRTNCLAPVFITQPQPLSVTPGSNATFSATAFGSVPFKYQWMQNGTNLTGATNSSISFTNIQPGNSAVYALQATNNQGVTLSTNAYLKVLLVTIYGNGLRLSNSVSSYAGAVTVQMTNFYSGGYIFYTLDGSTPTPFSPIYNGALIVSNNAVIKTLAYSVDFTQYAYSDPLTLQILPSYSLTTSTAGGGTIVRSLTNSTFQSNTIVTLTAIASNGWTFLQWQGDISGIVTTNSVVMTCNKSIQAVFGTTVTNSVGGSGSVVFDPPGLMFPYGFNFQAMAIPQTNNVFVLWGNAASGSTNPLSFFVTNANPEISALFTTLGNGQVSLTVVPVGHGQVTVNPRANGYSTGSSVTITATPSAGKSFLGWSGNATGSQNPLSIIVNQSLVIYANFSINNSLSLTLGSGQGTSGGVDLNLNGELGTHYRLDGSTDLVNWTALFNLTNAVGNLYYIDLNVSNANQKFYRSVILP